MGLATATKMLHLPAMTRERVIVLLNRSIREAGGRAKWAAKHELSYEHVRAVIEGVRDPGPKLLRALGLERVTTYRRVR